MSPPHVFEPFARLARRDGWALALRLTRNPEDAEDLMQQALLKAMRCFGAYNPPRPSEKVFRAWFGQVLLTTFLDRRKADARLQRLDEVLASAGAESESVVSSSLVESRREHAPEEALLARWEWERLCLAWSSLTRAEREALYLETFEDDTHRVQAQRLGLAPSTFSNRVSGARRHLRRLLDGTPHPPTEESPAPRARLPVQKAA